MSWFTYSQTTAEAVLFPQSSGTRGHKGDAFLQCDRGYFHVWPQKRSAFPPVSGVCWRQACASLFYEFTNWFDCVVAHCYGIQHTGSRFTSEVIFSSTVAKLSAFCCLLFTPERCPLTNMKAWWSACTDYISRDTWVFPNHFPLVEEAHSLPLTESLSLEGFSINQVQCFTESALRTPSWRSSWESCPPGCPCATRDGTLHWERWSADSWVIWGWHP